MSVSQPPKVCSNAFECAYNSYIDTNCSIDGDFKNDEFNCDAYASCLEMSIDCNPATGGASLSCWGAGAHAYGNIVGRMSDIGGTTAFSNLFSTYEIGGTSGNDYSYIFGSGSFSMANAIETFLNFSALEYLEVNAFGYASFVNNIMQFENDEDGADEIIVAGYFSMANSTTQLGNGSNVYMDARLAGYKSTMYCKGDNICNVFCRSPTACYGMYNFLINISFIQKKKNENHRNRKYSSR